MKFIRNILILSLLLFHVSADAVDTVYLNTTSLKDSQLISDAFDVNHIFDDCFPQCIDYPPHFDPITVTGELHPFLTDFVETPIHATVMQINKIITNVERKAGSLEYTAAADISTFFQNLSKPFDIAFERIREIFNFLSVAEPATASIGGDFLDYLSALKWSIDELNDNFNRGGPITSSSIQGIEDATLKVAFAVSNFANSALKLIDVISTAVNRGRNFGTMIIGFIGALRLTFENIDFVDEAMNILFGQSDKIVKAVYSKILDLFSSLIGSASNLPIIFDDSTPSSYVSQLRGLWKDDISQFSDQYKNLFASVDDKFELVTRISDTYGGQIAHLARLFSSFTLDDAPTQFLDINDFLNKVIGTLDFALSSLTFRVPDGLLAEANSFTASVDDLEVNFKSFTKSLTPPITASDIVHIDAVGGVWAAAFEAFQTSAYNFHIAATSYESELVAELVVTVGFLLQGFSDFHYAVTSGGNKILHVLTGGSQSVMLESFKVAREYATLVKSINYVSKLIPALYTTKTEEVPNIFENISKSADESFDMISGVLSKETTVIDQSLLPLLNDVANLVPSVKTDSLKVLTTTTSVPKPTADNIGLIEKDAIQLANDIESFTKTMSELIQKVVGGMTNVDGASLAWLFREAVTSTLEIVFYIVTSIERYASAVIGTGSITLSDIAKAFRTTLTQTTTEIKDAEKLGSGNVKEFKVVAGHTQSSIVKSADTITETLAPIVKPDVPAPTSHHFPAEIFERIGKALGRIKVNINNGNGNSITQGLKDLEASITGSFKTIATAFSTILQLNPNAWNGGYDTEANSALSNVQSTIGSFIQDVQTMYSKSENLSVKEVKAVTIKVVSAILAFGKAMAELVDHSQDNLTVEAAIILIGLETVVSMTSQSASYLMDSISNLVDVLNGTNANPLADVSNALAKMAVTTDSLGNHFVFSSDTSTSKYYDPVKTTLDAGNVQLTKDIAAITATIN